MSKLRPEMRKRYTLAHEIGHMVIRGKPYAAAARGGRGRFRAREREVERFAAEGGRRCATSYRVPLRARSRADSVEPQPGAEGYLNLGAAGRTR